MIYNPLTKTCKRLGIPQFSETQTVIGSVFLEGLKMTIKVRKMSP